MAIKRRLKTAADELRKCLARSHYSEPICEIAGNVMAGLGAAQIGAKINPTVKERLLEDVEKLEAAIKYSS